jgi:hypothetical protein
MFVDPVAVRQGRRVDLAGRQHDLAVLAVDRVAIVVDRHEIVVRADLLQLPERVEERAVIPQPHVAQRRCIPLDIGPRQHRVARELALLHALEPECPAGRGDRVLDVRRLPLLFVRRDHEALDGGCVRAAAERYEHIQGRGKDQRHHAPDGRDHR